MQLGPNPIPYSNPDVVSVSDQQFSLTYNLNREHPQGAILDTCDNWDIWSAVIKWHLGWSNHGDLWHLWHWLQYWQLRTWIKDNLCYLTINWTAFAILAMFTFVSRRAAARLSFIFNRCPAGNPLFLIDKNHFGQKSSFEGEPQNAENF